MNKKSTKNKHDYLLSGVLLLQRRGQNWHGTILLALYLFALLSYTRQVQLHAHRMLCVIAPTSFSGEPKEFSW